MLLSRSWARLISCWIPHAEVRAEMWAMGARHRGRVVEGAREEGRTPGLSFRRAVLLKAVIRESHMAAARLKTGRKRAHECG
jgi:hypothetical protein